MQLWRRMWRRVSCEQQLDIVKDLLRKLKCFSHTIGESCGSDVSTQSARSTLSRALWRGEWSSTQLWVISSLISLRLRCEYTSVMRLTGRDFVKSQITCDARYNVCICHNFVHFFEMFFFQKKSRFSYVLQSEFSKIV